MTSLLNLALLALLGCAPSPTGHGHDHGGDDHGGDDHGEHGGHGESIAITRWTDSHELFVELDVPVTGERFQYHAHVTRLADNHAATSGRLGIRFEQDGFAVESHADEQVARPGIFASTALAPTKPGVYVLVFTYTDGEERAEWPAGQVVVSPEAKPHEPEAEGEITFLKESQWQVPFQVAPASLVPLAPLVSAAATVRPSPASTTVVAAPVEGLVAWEGGLPVVGRRVSRGERLATLVPAGAAEHWARLQAELANARIDQDLAMTSLERVERLAAEQAVSQRRLEEARAALARAQARVSAAQRQRTAVTSGGAGAVPIVAPATGLVVSVGAEHGVAVSAGAPLVTVSSGKGVLLQGRVHSRDRTSLVPVASLSVLRGDWDAPVDLLAHGGAVLTEQLVFDASSLSAPVVVLVPEEVGLVAGDLVELSIGVGEPEPRLAVPREAVVELNGQDVVFVQRTGESFTRRRVLLGESDATWVEVSSGLQEGEMVVVLGGFDVHVASLAGALESHRH